MHPIRSVPALLVLALVLGACGSTTPPPAATTAAVSVPPAASEAPAPSEPASAAPTAAPTPAPTATPAPIDAANAFVRQVHDGLRANTSVAGSSQLGKAVTTLAGTIALAGLNADTAMTTTKGTTQSTAHEISTGGLAYEQVKDIWFATGPAATDDIASLLRAITGGVTDLGVETKNGQQLHHLQVTPPDTAAKAIGVPAKGVSNVVTTIDAWTTDDGTPVFMTLGATWDQKAGKKTLPATRSLDLEFKDVGGLVTVVPPNDIWKWNTSKRYGYTMGYPQDWQFEKGSKKYMDSYWGFDGDRVYADSFKSNGWTLGQLTSQMKRVLPEMMKLKGVKITSNKPAKLGSMPARKIEYSYLQDKKRNYAVAYMAVKNGRIYLMTFDTTAKTTKDDREMAATFASTFKRS